MKKAMKTSPRTIAMGVKVEWVGQSHCAILMPKDGGHWTYTGGDTGG